MELYSLKVIYINRLRLLVLLYGKRKRMVGLTGYSKTKKYVRQTQSAKTIINAYDGWPIKSEIINAYLQTK